MNQTLFFLIFLLFVCSSVPFRAQDAPREQRLSVTGGPLLETPFSGFYHSGVDGGQSRMRAGCTVGAFSTWASRRPSPCKANCSSTTSTLCSNGEASPATTATGGWRYPFMSVGIVRSVAVGCGILAQGLIPSSDLMPPSATVAGRLTSMRKTRQAGFPSCVTPIRGWPCASAMSSPAAYR